MNTQTLGQGSTKIRNKLNPLPQTPLAFRAPPPPTARLSLAPWSRTTPSCRTVSSTSPRSCWTTPTKTPLPSTEARPTSWCPPAEWRPPGGPRPPGPPPGPRIITTPAASRRTHSLTHPGLAGGLAAVAVLVPPWWRVPSRPCRPPSTGGSCRSVSKKQL